MRSKANPSVAWLPLYLLAVLAATLFPFWIHCASGEIDLAPPRAGDAFQNVLLFWPLGAALALRGWRGLACVSAAALFSACVETAQLWVLRSPSPWDVIANAAGAWLGWRFAHRLQPPAQPQRLAIYALGAASLLLASALLSLPRRAGSGFEEWPSMPLLIGNETTLDRPWTGEIAELALYDRATDDPAPWDAHGPPLWSSGGPVLWMRFEAPENGRIDGPGGPRSVSLRPPLESAARLEARGLILTGGLWTLPREIRDHVLVRLRERNRLSVLARVSPARLDTVGPGRIVSLSAGVSERGFTLGQSAGDVVFRVRTPVTSDNGTRPDASTNSSPLRRAEQRVWASYDGLRSRIEIDGVCRGERILASKRGAGPLGEALAITLVTGTGLAGLGAAGRRRAGRRWQRAALGSAAAAAFWLPLWFLGAWAHLPFFEPWAFGLGVVSALLGVRAGFSLEDDSHSPASGAEID